MFIGFILYKKLNIIYDTYIYAMEWSYSAFYKIVNFVADSSTAREVCTAALLHTDNTTEQ